MAKIVRPYPRRPAWRYPVGTRLTLRDGRQFEVILHRWTYEHDWSYGNGGDPDTLVAEAKIWRKIENGGPQ